MFCNPMYNYQCRPGTFLRVPGLVKQFQAVIGLKNALASLHPGLSSESWFACLHKA
jgi:hypothetical protein